MIDSLLDLQSSPSPTGDDFPTDGITLKGIKHFINFNGGEQAFTGLRTSEVCNRFLKPSTVDQQESCCVAFKTDPTRSGHIGQATAYLSQSWGHEFLDVVAALEDYDLRQPTPTVFSFDLFTLNQHEAAKHELTWWVTTYTVIIEKLKRTLLVLEWEDPKPLSRTWVLMDIVSTISTKSDLQVIVSSKNRRIFSTALVNDFDHIVFKTCNVDSKGAQAFNPSDRDYVFNVIEATRGFEELSKQVIRIFREWMAQSGTEALQSLPEGERQMSTLQQNLARLLREQGKGHQAEILYQETLQVQRTNFGDTHEATLQTVDTLSALLRDEGKLPEATELLITLHRAQGPTFGEGHPKSLATATNIASLLGDQGKFEEAVLLLREALTVKRRTLGDQHPATLQTLHTLGVMSKEMNRTEDAKKYLREALNGRRSRFGDTHPDTQSSKKALTALIGGEGAFYPFKLINFARNSLQYAPCRLDQIPQ